MPDSRALTQHETKQTWLESSTTRESNHDGNELIVAALCCTTASKLKRKVPCTPEARSLKQQSSIFCIPSMHAHNWVTDLNSVLPVGCAAGWVGRAEPGAPVKRPNSPSAGCFLGMCSPNAPPAAALSESAEAPADHTQEHARYDSSEGWFEKMNVIHSIFIRWYCAKG